jgi:hypothetical protein
VAPLRRTPAAAAAAEPALQESAAERGTEALGAALEDLEHDFETGKLDAADHDRLRADLEAALARGRAEIARAAASARAGRTELVPGGDGDDLPAPVAAPRCGACSQPVAHGARFCSHCGAKLA